MDWLERELKGALSREEPPADFAERVLRRGGMPVRPGCWGPRWLGAAGTRATGLYPHDGECGGCGIPREDEDRGGAGHLQEAGAGGGVSQCLDQIGRASSWA